MTRTDMDESSDLSSLSSLSPAPSDDELDVEVERQPNGILKFFHPVKDEDQSTPKSKSESKLISPKEPPPPATTSSRKERHASPSRQPSFADNPDLAFIVMFRSRFNAAFPKSLQNFGPQELEKEVAQEEPGPRVENFLCAILSLLLNRKQDVKPGHYNRALEDALSTNKNQWPRSWGSKNPLSGQATFKTLTPSERLNLLRVLITWALGASEAIRTIISTSYKQNRWNDDLNQPLSVQPWGLDSLKRRYYLIEGLDDTAFRVYREGNPAALKDREWVSVAGSLQELKALSHKLDKVDGGPKAKKLSIQIMQAVPRFEATEEKRRRREYRQAQKQRFKRPEPGFSSYEGRTRGKRIRYTYSDDEPEFESESTARRSARTTGAHTPATEPALPVTTLSGRQVRKPRGIESGSRAPSVYSDRTQGTDAREPSSGPNGRSRRSANGHGLSSHENGIVESEPDFGDDIEDDEDDDEEDEDNGDEHIPDESEDEEDDFDDEDEVMADDDQDEKPQGKRRSLIIKLPMPIREAPPPGTGTAAEMVDSPMTESGEV